VRYKRDEINELLVDYLEKDISEGLKNDLDLVITNSPTRSKSLQALAETRKIVKSSEPQVADPGDAFFDQLHSKIMAEVGRTAPQKRIRLWLGERTWTNGAAAAVVLLLAGSVFFNLLKPTVTIQSAGVENQGDMLLSISVEVPEAFADSLLNDTNADDFYMDAMAGKVAQLEESHATDIMNELGE